jgi:hypothetical protein
MGTAVKPRILHSVLLACGGALLFVGSAACQQPGSGLATPRLFVLAPNGAKAGTTVDVTFTGQDLEEPEVLFFSHPGIKAVPIIPPAPPVDPKKPPAKPAPKPPITQFKVTVAADTPLGIHDARLVNKLGISNPRAFVVGDLAEVAEKEPNNDVAQAQRVELNTTINGAISQAADVDYFVFAGKKGQRVVVSCLASSIDSRLVAALELYDSTGRQLAFNRHYQNNDALLDCVLPANGDYFVRLYEFTHILGSPEHFYRLTISTSPWIDAILPLALEPGKTTQVTVYGRNLPGGQLDPTAVENGSVLEKLLVPVTAPTARERLAFSGHIEPNMTGLDGFEFRLRNATGTSNPFFLSFARGPVTLDNERNDMPETAQEITLPCEISGRVEKRGDRDWYSFTAKKNDAFTIDVLSDRLGAQTDMYYTLRKAGAKQDLAEVDDNPEVLHPFKFYAHCEDPPAYRFVVPEDGKYLLQIGSRDADTRAGPREYYHVRFGQDRPDFRLIVLPADDYRPEGCCLRQGGQENYTVLVWREGGFAGPITLNVEGLPAGVSSQPQTIGPSMKQTALIVGATPTAAAWTGEIRIKGTATINGQPVVREARSASITWPFGQPQGIPTVSRLDRGVMLAVREKAPFGLTATVERPFVLQGGKVNVALKLDRLWPDAKTPVQVAPIEPQFDYPQGLAFNNNNQPFPMAPGKDTATASFSVGSNVPPGTYNLVLRGTAQIPYNKDPMAKQKQNVNVVQPSTPMTLTVLPQKVANVSVDNANLTVKPGSQTPLLVKAVRINDYAGEFKVLLVLPANEKGLAATEVTIPAGKDEAKLILNVPADAAPGNRANLVVRVTATLQGNTPLPHETKINVNIVK